MTQTTTAVLTADAVVERLTVVEQQVRELQAQVAWLKGGRNGAPGARLSLDDPAVAEARRIAAEIFGARVEVTVECDPESPEHEFIGFDVEYRGEPKELIHKRREWHRRANAATNGRSRDFRLSIFP